MPRLILKLLEPRRLAPGAALLTALLLTGPAPASVTVLVGEPFGRFGTKLPVGHVAVYLDHVCADGPLKLRACRAAEPEGVVIARYHNIGRIDWVASPVLEFLYAVGDPAEVPERAGPELVWQMQQSYRRRYLAGLVPDGHELDRATNEWWETAGAAYNRRIWGYRLDSSAAQDARLIERMNADANLHRYRVRHANCADFVADVVNFYYPGAVRHSNRIADLGFMLPKQVARSVAAYGKQHPEAGLEVLEVPQIAGSAPRSRPVRGGVELGLKTKRYLFGMLVVVPAIPPTIAVLYLVDGRWKLGQDARVLTPADFGPRTQIREQVAGTQPARAGTPE